MKYVFLLACLLTFFYACSDSSTNKTALAEGEKVYSFYCSSCHGMDGKLGLNDSKDLTKSTLSLEEQIEMVTNGKGMMTAYKEILSAEQIKSVAQYVTTLRN